MLCLGIKTQSTAKAIFSLSVCFILYLRKFSWLSNHSSIDLFWQQFTAYWSVSSVMYCKCYLFQKGSPSCSCSLQLDKPLHLGQDTLHQNFLCHLVMSLPSFHSCRSFFENAHSLAMIAHFMKLFKSAVERITPSQIPVIAVDQPLIPLVEQTQWTLGEMYNEDKCHNAWQTPYWDGSLKNVWAGILDLQLCCLHLMRAFREANFSMYDSLHWIMPTTPDGSLYITETCVSFHASMLASFHASMCTHTKFCNASIVL